MIIKLLVDVLQMVPRGSPVLILDLNWLDFEGVHEGFGCLKFCLLHSKNMLWSEGCPKDGATPASFNLLGLWVFLQVKNIGISS